ncbi:GtrA family protein [Microbacterium sp. APC 3898]|uniref:GtrA family protein n=2 Tax=Planococcus TaxID=1372 RepID=A0ABT7ZF66_9BACL|nr:MULTISPECIES: GtrA family protein [Terrabacteria group]MBF6633370.1 GtrA family protein [Planococcus sp. (in: firmicutes)]MBD8013493.1 GtrA family protein [Planococcus wigleyi]MDN3425791.1 GtrA family protein [Planococcus sp. APC 4016]MDN3437385.1 GtrA family protein [Planococcus sp. APC 3900]MDN3500577.1 GtrA family protein [Microbacterium sp. APC 3898]
MKKILTKDWRSILMYLIMGGWTTVVNIVVYWICEELFHLDYRISTTIAWVFAVVFAYVVNKRFVFKSVTNTWRDRFAEMGSFFGFRVLSFFMDLGTMMVLVGLLSINGTISKILANVIVLVANYIFSKKFIFKDRSAPAAEKVQ